MPIYQGRVQGEGPMGSVSPGVRPGGTSPGARGRDKRRGPMEGLEAPLLGASQLPQQIGAQEQEPKR